MLVPRRGVLIDDGKGPDGKIGHGQYENLLPLCEVVIN